MDGYVNSMSNSPLRDDLIVTSKTLSSDRTCPAKGCRGIPLLRSPEPGLAWFCPSCETDGEFSVFVISSDSPTNCLSVLDPAPSHSEMQQPSSPSFGSSTHHSRSSTPPTEDADVPGSPAFAIPAETEDSIRRRQQSDFASAEIGRRLLRGWAMLGEECPRSSCYGIPLVRPPKTGQENDPRKVRSCSVATPNAEIMCGWNTNT